MITNGPIAAALKVLSIGLASCFFFFGIVKIAAITAVRERAASLKISLHLYQALGLVEITAAAGLIVGLVIPGFGLCAALVLALLMTALTYRHFAVGNQISWVLSAAVLAIFNAVLVSLFILTLFVTGS